MRRISLCPISRRIYSFSPAADRGSKGERGRRCTYDKWLRCGERTSWTWREEKREEKGRNKIQRKFYGVSRVVNSDCYVLYSLILQVRNLEAANNFEKSRRFSWIRLSLSLSLHPAISHFFKYFFLGEMRVPFSISSHFRTPRTKGDKWGGGDSENKVVPFLLWKQGKSGFWSSTGGGGRRMKESFFSSSVLQRSPVHFLCGPQSLGKQEGHFLGKTVAKQWIFWAKSSISQNNLIFKNICFFKFNYCK